MVVRGKDVIPSYVSDAVRDGQRNGQLARDIVLRFNDRSEQAAAAAQLSMTPRALWGTNCRTTPLKSVGYQAGHFVLWSFLVMAAIVNFLGAANLVDFVVAVALVGAVIATMRRNVWAYNIAIAYSIWEAFAWPEVVRSSDGTIEDIVATAISFILIGLFATLAFRLRQAVFPYMGILRVKRDKWGEPVLLNILLNDGNETPN